MDRVLVVVPFVVLSLLLPAALYALLHPAAIADRVGRLGDRARRPCAAPTARPLGEVVADVHRLGRRFHARQTSFAKAAGIRHAYDAALVECCAALGVEHLLGVIDPGRELDRERARVERVLHRWGVDLSDLDQAA